MVGGDEGDVGDGAGGGGDSDDDEGWLTRLRSFRALAESNEDVAVRALRKAAIDRSDDELRGIVNWLCEVRCRVLCSRLCGLQHLQLCWHALMHAVPPPTWMLTVRVASLSQNVNTFASMFGPWARSRQDAEAPLSAAMRRVASSLQLVRHKPGTLLYRQGDCECRCAVVVPLHVVVVTFRSVWTTDVVDAGGDAVYVVVRGRVSIWKRRKSPGDTSTAATAAIALDIEEGGASWTVGSAGE
jgi:hypothetical protein